MEQVRCSGSRPPLLTVDDGSWNACGARPHAWAGGEGGRVTLTSHTVRVGGSRQDFKGFTLTERVRRTHSGFCGWDSVRPAGRSASHQCVETGEAAHGRGM
jgi:hypothetical protein